MCEGSRWVAFFICINILLLWAGISGLNYLCEVQVMTIDYRDILKRGPSPKIRIKLNSWDRENKRKMCEVQNNGGLVQ